MDENKSRLEKWHQRLTFLLTALSIPAMLFTLSKTARDATRNLFVQKPAESVASVPRNLNATSGLATSSGEPPQPTKSAPSPSQPLVGPAPTTPPVSEPRKPLSQVDDFVQKYVDGGVSHPDGRPQWAVLISDKDHSNFPELNSAVSAALSEASYRDVAVFRPSLIRDGKLDEIYDDDPVLIRKLGEICDGFIVAKANSSLRQDTAVQGLYTVELSLQVRVIQAPTGVVRKEFTISERGAGFTSNEAETNARERAAKSLKEQLKVAL